jgi:ABC-2 type transport system ATP-binding protein
MRQKVLIAAAVLHDPRIVVLDEPFSGLDVSAARVLKGFVRAIADEGKMVVFSSHVLEVVEQVCSRVVILKDGRIVGHDSVARLRSMLQLPSLDAVFAALVAEEDVAGRTRGLVAAMKSWPRAPGAGANSSSSVLTSASESGAARRRAAPRARRAVLSAARTAR